MAKNITFAQLNEAIKTAPREIEIEGKKFLQRGLSEYKRVVVQGSPWRVGQTGGGAPRKSGNLREKHDTRIKGLEGRFGINPRHVRYALPVHEGTYKMKKRPWLDYARQQAESRVKLHYQKFLDEIIKHIAT